MAVGGVDRLGGLGDGGWRGQVAGEVVDGGGCGGGGLIVGEGAVGVWGFGGTYGGGKLGVGCRGLSLLWTGLPRGR